MLVNQTEYSGEKANGKIYHYIIHIYPINLLEKNKNKLRVVNILVCVCAFPFICFLFQLIVNVTVFQFSEERLSKSYSQFCQASVW